MVVEIDGCQLQAALPGRQGRLLFAYLALHRQRPVRRDELTNVLWPEKPPSSPENALNTLISRLRSALGEGVVRGRSELMLQLAPDAWIDVDVALDGIQRAERALERSEWHESSSAASVALEVAEQGLLPELQAAWVDQERGRIEELQFRALECLAACGLAIGGARLSDTERAARALIDGSPFRETGYRFLMQALAERGRVAEALTVFDDVRQLLQQELGAPPGAALRSLHERLLSQRAISPQAEREDPLAAGSSTVTLLVSDLVGGDHAVSENEPHLRLSHARALRHAVAAHGGGQVTDTAGGLIAVFTNVQSALRCAVQLQQAVERRNRRDSDRPLAIRSALHCGEPLSSHPDHLTLLSVAQRLCRHSEAGLIVVSALVRALAGPAHDFHELAPIHQPQADGPLRRFEVPWEPATQPAFTLPGGLPRREQDAFVGRESDLRWLWGLYDDACRGRRRIVLLRGEPGVGKTRLASELALRAYADGAAVLYGHCDEEPLLPHQPFVEALRHYLAACPLGDLVGQVGRGSGELRRLVPELVGRLPDLAEPLAGDPEGERYRLFEAVSALLVEAAEARPIVLVLDDLHWADKPTLLLLSHLARHTSEVPLLVIGTYRDAALEPRHALSQTLAELGREHSFERRTLGSLDEAAVGRLVLAHTGSEAPKLAAAVFEETEGNAFFVVEMLRHLAESGGATSGGANWAADFEHTEIGIPEGVKDVIGRRIARLGSTTQRALLSASACGREFELAVLEHMSDLDEDALVDALDEAMRARVIEELSDVIGRYTFSHALIRETIYGGLTATRRSLLHRRVAKSLEQAHAGDLEPHRAELAHHLTQAGTAGDLEQAIVCGAGAGDHAMAQLAYEAAAGHYRQTVALLNRVEPRSEVRRCELVIAQGEAECRAGDPAYRETLLEGARLAGELQHGELLARAALANNRGSAGTVTGIDRERVSMLERALEAQGDGDTPQRASLLAHLALELLADPDWQRRSSLSDEALAMARRLDDPPTLLRTLNHRYVTLRDPGTFNERSANAREAGLLAERVEEPVLAFHAARHGCHAAMEAGELLNAHDLLECAAGLAAQLRQPVLHWYVALDRAKHRSITEPPCVAEQLARTAFDIGRDAGQHDAFVWFSNQVYMTAFLQGTLDCGRPNMLKVAEMAMPFDSNQGPSGSRAIALVIDCLNIVTLCEVGRTDSARERFDVLMSEALAELPQDWATLPLPALACVACAHLGDHRRAETLHSLLEPHAGRFIECGPSWLGTTAHYLGLVATPLGRPDEADARFEDAVATYDALGAAPWSARARLDWARSLLITRRNHRDGARAEELCHQALAAAQNLGLVGVQRKAADVLRELRT